MKTYTAKECLKDASFVWHPNTQMGEWGQFTKITDAKGAWLTDSDGNRMIDAVASMWCNVWGHSNPQLVRAITHQSKKLQHSSLFNLTHEPAERLAEKLVEISPGMHRVFYSDNGSSAMEIAIKMALQYSKNSDTKKTCIATLENGYHGDTFGAMSVGYVPEFFGNFKRQLFPVVQFPAPQSYKIPKGYTIPDYTNYCLEKIEARFTENNDIAGLVMESGAQVAGGVNIYPAKFQSAVRRICKKHDVLLVLDEIATGFGRLGSMPEYKAQKSTPDIVAYGKMLTGGYMTMAATLASKKVYDSFLGEFDEMRHLFHGHTYTGNPLAAAVANENLKMYENANLIRKIQSTSKIFKEFYDTISNISLVGDIRHKGMLMGIELVQDKQKKTPISPKSSPNKILFEHGKRHGIYLRTLGNIVMLVPPLAISEPNLRLLLKRTISTIKAAESELIQ